jgi:hypothetical protein
VSEVAQRQLDSLAEFLAAVEHVTASERPELTVWGALAEALADWLSSTAYDSQPDLLRGSLSRLIEVYPESGAPGGSLLSDVLDAAILAWAERAALRSNDGLPFRR